ncbi:hypothetical protein SCLARK_00909 [Spiroplasma clarkii]|nr:SGNH/GDSL hydrolase family protein [Spiroplasma clarkii]ARU91518.1 hypothetical protein SCLARK_00909 [Spiroplasma clarkii]
MSTGLIVPTVTGVVACLPATKFDPTAIGTGIDTSGALDDSISSEENEKSDFTNYYIVGDSLSDVDGIGTYMVKKLQPLLDQVIGNLTQGIPIPNLQNLKVNLKVALDGDGYGFADADDNHHSAFSNGGTAGYLLNEELGFKPMKSSNIFVTEPNDDDGEGYGNNYAVGGATAAQMDGFMGSILNDATIEKQTVALIKQHKISTNDLTFFEIGGNDLFAMIDNYKDTALVDRVFNEGIKSIRTGIYNLLNHGMSKILFMTPPKMNEVPKYGAFFKEDANEEQKAQAKFIEEIGEKYQKAILDIITEVNTYYENKVEVFDLYNEFADILDWFKNKDVDNNIIDQGYTDESGGYYVLNDETNALLPGVAKDDFIYEKDDYKNGIVTIAEFIQKITELASLAGGFSKSARSYQTRAEGTQTYVQLLMLGRNTKNPTWDIKNYFFTDYVHPTAQVHEYVAKLLAKKFDLK